MLGELTGGGATARRALPLLQASRTTTARAQAAIEIAHAVQDVTNRTLAVAVGFHDGAGQRCLAQTIGNGLLL
jgi:hypothetical protein